MNKKTFFLLLLSLIMNIFITGSELCAQEKSSKHGRKKMSDDKITEQKIVFSRIDSLINSHQFVFQSEYNMNSDMVFVLVDSSYGAVQNGIRNNLQGRITQYEVKKNEKKGTFSITIKMRGELYTADVFIFIGAFGNGKATVMSESPGNFSINGEIVNFENANINEWPSHFIH